MDDLDRLYHRLLDAVRDGAPQLRERRFRLGDIPQHLLPYRLHRRDLGFEDVRQYERALAQLAAGERGYLSADAAVQQAFRQAVDGGTGDPGTDDGGSAVAEALRTHGDALVALAPAGGRPGETPTAASVAIAAPAPAAAPGAGMAAAPPSPPATGGLEIRIARADAAPAEPPPAAPSVPPRAAPPPTAAEPEMPFPVRPPAPVTGGACPHCARPLPTARGVTFCPYCGENLTVRRCPACSTELETGWRFCITCGREVDDPAASGAPGAAGGAAG
jgi:hypothetical protein